MGALSQHLTGCLSWVVGVQEWNCKMFFLICIQEFLIYQSYFYILHQREIQETKNDKYINKYMYL